MNKEYLTNLLEKGKREDDRKVDEYRNAKVEIGPILQAAGSAKAILGNTEVIVGVSMSVGEPFPDSPNSGILICNSELSPLASAHFELGPPREDAIELARVTDRMIRESKMVDMDKLCIKKGEAVWTLFVDILPINADGNLFDAAALATTAALVNTRIPKYDTKEEKVLFGEFSNKKLPINCKPIMCTFGKMNGDIFIDPTEREELAMDACLSIATTSDGHIHAMQKGGIGTFTADEIFKMAEIASKKGEELRKLIK